MKTAAVPKCRFIVLKNDLIIERIPRHNPCESLQDSVVSNGKWDCTHSPDSKTCRKERIGDVCHLNCNPPFKVEKVKIVTIKIIFSRQSMEILQFALGLDGFQPKIT